MKAIEKIPGVHPLLSRYDAEFVVACKEPRIVNMDESDVFEALLEIINRSYAELGLALPGNYPAEREQFMRAKINMLRSDLLNYFPNVTIREVSNAIKRGIRKQYGEYYGFNVIAIHGFVEKYLESEERNKALKKQRDFELITQSDQEQKVIDKWQIMFDGLKNCYETFCKSNRIIDFGNVNYEFLVAAGLINLTPEDKEWIFNIAKAEIQRELEQQVPDTRTAYRRLVESRDDVTPAISRAKEIALRDYFATKPEFEKLIPILKTASLVLE